MKYIFLCLLTIFFSISPAAADEVTVSQIQNLRSKFIALNGALEKNQFKRPLVLESKEAPSSLQGDIYALVSYPIKNVIAELNNPDHWCDVLLLHINTKYCRATTRPSGTIIVVNVGKKTPEELKYVAQIDFTYRAQAITPGYFEIKLRAADGPLGTSNYRISLEGLEAGNGKTFLHLSYSYSMNLVARLGMLTYLKTIASDKLGFTVIGKEKGDQVNYVRGVRGLIERNTMRYYLAIDSYLGAATKVPENAQLEYRLNTWFAATEQYPLQLHEMNKDEYLSMKRAENLRQRLLR